MAVSDPALIMLLPFFLGSSSVPQQAGLAFQSAHRNTKAVMWSVSVGRVLASSSFLSFVLPCSSLSSPFFHSFIGFYFQISIPVMLRPVLSVIFNSSCSQVAAPSIIKVHPCPSMHFPYATPIQGKCYSQLRSRVIMTTPMRCQHRARHRSLSLNSNSTAQDASKPEKSNIRDAERSQKHRF